MKNGWHVLRTFGRILAALFAFSTAMGSFFTAFYLFFGPLLTDPTTGLEATRGMQVGSGIASLLVTAIAYDAAKILLGKALNANWDKSQHCIFEMDDKGHAVGECIQTTG